VKSVFSSLKPIEFQSNLRFICCTKEQRSFKKKMRVAERKINEELNLQKFIQRQRMTTAAILSVLTGP